MTDFPWPQPAWSPEPISWKDNRFWSGSESRKILSFDAEQSHWSNELTDLHEAEAGRNHPIDIASRSLAVQSMRLLRPHISSQVSSPAPILLDVGCSSGYVLDELQQTVPDAFLIGSDYIAGPLEALGERMPNIPLLQFDLRKCPLPSESIDGITCLNVLEHIDDDSAALEHLYRILKRGGIAHIEVPAGPALYDIYDEHLLHHRRYRLNELIEKARRCGFTIERATHLGFLVYPAFAWTKKQNRRKLSLSPEAKQKMVASQIRATRHSPLLQLALRIETTLGQTMQFPYGIRCVTRLKKPTS